jgi:copper chaperone NosL
MRTRIAPLIALVAVLACASCGKEGSVAEKPAPHEVTDASIGHYCGMALAEHAGPKAQIFLTGHKDPVWFSSVRDAFAFTMLPEEPKDFAAIYVNDMGRVKNWDQPEPDTWIDAKKALYVIGSDRPGGMGGEEAIPFGEEADARRFSSANGGRIVSFAEVPESYVLPGAAPASTSPRAPQQAKDPLAGGTGHDARGNHAQGH